MCLSVCMWVALTLSSVVHKLNPWEKMVSFWQKALSLSLHVSHKHPTLQVLDSRNQIHPCNDSSCKQAWIHQNFSNHFKTLFNAGILWVKLYWTAIYSENLCRVKLHTQFRFQILWPNRVKKIMVDVQGCTFDYIISGCSWCLKGARKNTFDMEHLHNALMVSYGVQDERRSIGNLLLW